MTLEPIGDDRIPDAVALLSRGFPGRAPSFWEACLRRLSAYRRRTNGRPIGQLMLVRGEPVGVILTIASSRPAGAAARDVVNLSSWFVEARHRWLAPRMLQAVTADDSVTYTDLSPTLETMRLNERLGFQTTARGVVLYCLPWTAIAGSGAPVVPFERLPKGALAPADEMLLAHHRDLGCMAAALRADDGYHPLLFQPIRRKGLPVASLVLAPSRRLVAENIGTISRFLLRRGALLLSLHGETAAGGGILWNRVASVQVKGRWEGERVDHTYSEIVFLGV